MPVLSPRELVQAVQEGRLSSEDLLKDPLVDKVDGIIVQRRSSCPEHFQERTPVSPHHGGLGTQKELSPYPSDQLYWVGSEHRGDEEFRYYFVLIRVVLDFRGGSSEHTSAYMMDAEGTYLGSLMPATF